jgi:pimeloyl-ACP methyl ester carboxylesterase
LPKWLASPRFVPIEDAGHMPQVERPAEFVDAVKSVVEKSQHL